jgi:exopolysaccharide biosynthesis polyprenyl glycosylphosphotransferase
MRGVTSRFRDLSEEDARATADVIRLDVDEAPAIRLGHDAFTSPPAVGAHARYRGIARLVVLTDVLCVVLALALAFLLRESLSPISREWLVVALWAPFVWVAIFYGHGLYSPQHLSKFEEYRRVLGSSAVGIVVIILASFWSRSSFSRIWIGMAFMFVLVFELVSRSLWRRYTDRLRADGRLALRTIVVGTNGEASKLAETLGKEGSGFVPLGFVPAEDVYIDPGSTLPLLGRHYELVEAIRNSGAECIFVAASEVSSDKMIEIATLSRRLGMDVRLTASLPEIISSRVSVQPIGGVMSMALRPAQFTGVQSLVKRVFDVAVCFFLLLLALPFLLLIGLAILLESGRPVFFRQARSTKGGRIFEMFKFRTMRSAPEDDLDTSAPFFKLADDPRITRVGRILRRASLDEFPQLLNVLRGDMSLVGPRPLPVDQVEANLSLMAVRHDVLAGVTGWWQINGRSSVGAEEAVRLDMFYIENWSLGLDMYILARTFGAVLKGRGAV